MKTCIIYLLCSITLSLTGQWKSLKGPFGGHLYSYANEGISTYVGSTDGLYRSDNDGANWIRLDNGLAEFYEPWNFCVDQDEVFVSYKDSKTNEDGFAYSNDKGTHWIKRPLPGADWLTTSKMAYSNGLLMTKGENGLIESTDQGQTWTSSNLGIKASEIQMVKSNDSYFFVATYSTIYRRSISDTSWQLILNAPEWFFTFHVTDSLLLILKDKKPGLRSLNNGLTWDTINLIGNTGDQMIADFGDSLYYTDLSWFYKSTDHGLSWKQIKAFPRNGLQSLSMLRAGSSLLMNTNIGLIKTNDDFSSFEKYSTGMSAGTSNRMIATDSFLFVLGDLSIERYDLFARTWSEKSSITGVYLDDLLYYEGVLYISSQNSNNLYISKDNGATFETKQLPVISRQVTNNSKILGFNHKILITGLQINTGQSEILISEDFGQTWNILVIKDWITNAEVSPRDVTLYNNQVIVFAIDNSGNKKFYKSQDLNKWEFFPLAFQNNISNFSFNELLSSQGQLFMNAYSGNACNLFKFDSVSLKFVDCNGLSDLCNNSSVFKNRLISKGDRMILITSYGYYKSDDGGSNWIRVVDELGTQNYSIWIDMALKDDKLYGTTHYWGAMETDWTGFVSDKVKGFLFYDSNQNDIYDTTDYPLEKGFVKIQQSRQYLPADKQGNFTFFYSSPIKDTLVPVLYSKHGTFKPDKQSFNSGDTSLRFAYSVPAQIEDLTVRMISFPRAVPGFHYFLEIQLWNQGAQACTGKVVLNYDSAFIYQSASAIPASISANSLIWDFANLLPLEERKIRVEFKIPDSIAIKTPFQHQVSLQDLTCNDLDLSDNEFIINDKIVASRDPNEMSVDKSQITKAELENKIPLTYTINFQNTGNHEAEFVKLKNSLSNFDLTTFAIIAASHPFSFKINDGDLLEVTFDMIHLPDSLGNESRSHGYFSYSIAPLPEKVYNNTIVNSASIYFDYNKPILTNEAITKVVEVVSSKDLDFNKDKKIIAVPNPNCGEFRIFSPYFINGEIASICIFNLQGKCVYDGKGKIYDGYKLELNAVNPGIYILKVGNDSKLVCKILVQE